MVNFQDGLPGASNMQRSVCLERLNKRENFTCNFTSLFGCEVHWDVKSIGHNVEPNHPMFGLADLQSGRFVGFAIDAVQSVSPSSK